MAMARRARSTLPPYGVFHVNARGVEQRAIFLDDSDRRLFLALFDLAQRRYRWHVLVFCLMTNHFHFVVEAAVSQLSRGMQLLNGRYAQHFNDRYERSGHLFQDRFHARHVDSDEYREIVCEYVLDNPVRAGICLVRDEWPWLGGAFYAPA
jgi:REP-associated tyrosine transposase